MIFDYVIADTHFRFKFWLDREPKRVEKMKSEGHNNFDKIMIDLWNKYIDKDSSALHLGDFAMGSTMGISEVYGSMVIIHIFANDCPQDMHSRFRWGQ